MRNRGVQVAAVAVFAVVGVSSAAFGVPPTDAQIEGAIERFEEAWRAEGATAETAKAAAKEAVEGISVEELSGRQAGRRNRSW